jgi:hypothetical protein
MRQHLQQQQQQHVQAKQSAMCRGIGVWMLMLMAAVMKPQQVPHW